VLEDIFVFVLESDVLLVANVRSAGELLSDEERFDPKLNWREIAFLSDPTENANVLDRNKIETRVKGVNFMLNICVDVCVDAGCWAKGILETCFVFFVFWW
jgi:hypothetical protein